MEEELNYSTVVFKDKSKPPHTEINDVSTTYSSIKKKIVSPKTNDASASTDKRTVNTAQSEAASHSHYCHLLVVCSGTLCILILLSVIVYITVMMNERKANFEAKLGNLTAANQQLISEISVLQNDTGNLNWTLGVILTFNSFPVDAFCPQKKCQPCQKDWIQFQEKCYLFNNQDAPWKTWTESRTYCQGNASDLVVIDSLQEQIFISSKIPWYYDNYHGYWMGLNQTADKNWRWVDGRNITVQYWRNGTSDPSDRCALIIPVYNNTANWNSANCAMFNRFICESEVLIKSN